MAWSSRCAARRTRRRAWPHASPAANPRSRGASCGGDTQMRRSSRRLLALGLVPRVAGIHRAANSGVCGWLDTGDKPRYDNAEFILERSSGDVSIRIIKPWIELTAEAVRALPGQLGVYQLADAEGRVVYI